MPIKVTHVNLKFRNYTKPQSGCNVIAILMLTQLQSGARPMKIKRHG